MQRIVKFCILINREGKLQLINEMCFFSLLSTNTITKHI